MWFVVGVALSFGASLIGSFIADYFRPTSSHVEESEDNKNKTGNVIIVEKDSQTHQNYRRKRDLLEKSLGSCNLPWDDRGCSEAIRLGEELEDLIKKTTKNVKKSQQIRRILNENDRRLENLQNDTACSLDNPMCGMDSKYMYSSWW